MTPRRLLAVETSTSLLSVALLEGESGTLLAELTRERAGAHAEALLPAVEHLLTWTAIPLEAVDAFAVSVGPGSFTGLRIGLATVKAFAFGTSRPVAAVSSLAALAARAAGAEGPVAAALDARRGELYAACWKGPEAEGEPLVAESVWRPEALADALPDAVLLLAGEDAEPAARETAETAALEGKRVRVLTGSVARPRASDVGRLGLRQLAAGQGLAAAEVVPRYLRRAEAEARRTGRRLEDP